MSAATPTLLNLCPVAIDLCFTRGDNPIFSFTLSQSGTPIDITGSSFLLTVDPSPVPADAVNNLFQLTGTIPVGTDGVVQFQATAVQMDQTPAVYFYDVQWTDSAGAIRTVVAGQFEIRQDVTK